MTKRKVTAKKISADGLVQPVRSVKGGKVRKVKVAGDAFDKLKADAIARMKIAMTMRMAEYKGWVEEDKKEKRKYNGVLAGPEVKEHKVAARA